MDKENRELESSDEQKSEEEKGINFFFIFIIIIAAGLPALSIVFLFSSDFQNLLLNLTK